MYEELVKRLRIKSCDGCPHSQKCINDETAECVIRTQAADAIEALEKQLAETEATADHEHCRYIETLGERDGMEARCQIISAERDKYKASLDQIIHCAACKYAEPFPTDPRVLICANPKWVPTGDGRGVKEPYVKPDDYCSFGEVEDNEMDD